ncbi:MAG: DUF1345 domain-containing protein [Gammaproteobacteria bacterium]|nr:DUF1345 domain-containing protein [Gammaproteobacteria bacterium]MDE2348889.1 DUF1345 domain-containing protein [Gammaproteobacteria bacterium]
MYKYIRYHPRLLIATAIGIAVYFGLPSQWSAVSRLLVAWNGGVLLFLALVFHWMTSLSAERICERFEVEDEGTTVISIIVVSVAVLSLAAIIAVLSTLKHVSGAQRAAHLALAAGTLLSSWLLVPTIFTSQYADLFYSADAARRPLQFPRTDMPVFWDFAYFSFTISCACQTSDVSTLDAPIRRVVLAHTLVSFLFNAAILGFAINVGAGLIGG